MGLNEDTLIENQIIFYNGSSVVRPTYDKDVAYKSSVCLCSVKSTEQLLSFLWGLLGPTLTAWSIEEGSCISCIFTCQNAKPSRQWSQFTKQEKIETRHFARTF